MPHYLALDTCTEICSVGLWSDGKVTTQVSDVPREHTRRILPMAESLLAESELGAGELDGVFCTRGPGSFTGVRIGISVAQGLSFACNTPVWPLSTLAVLAIQGQRNDPTRTIWRVAMDARMGEVYHGLYRVDGDQTPEPLEPEQLLSLEALSARSMADRGDVGYAGAGWPLVRPGEQAPVVRTPSPEAVLDCGLRAVYGDTVPVTAMELQPVYLRDNVARASRNNRP